MIIYLACQLAFAVFNLSNVKIDAYRILRDKTIAHGINFGAYMLFVLILYYFAMRPDFSWARFPYIDLAVYLVSAFTNRQFSFDIPLNLRRGLKFDYVSLAKPPKAFLDRIEIAVFGYNGRAPLFVYGVVWLICLIIDIWI